MEKPNELNRISLNLHASIHQNIQILMCCRSASDEFSIFCTSPQRLAANLGTFVQLHPVAFKNYLIGLIRTSLFTEYSVTCLATILGFISEALSPLLASKGLRDLKYDSSPPVKY